MSDFSERNASLWVLVASPALWATHFALSYATAALGCARFASADGSLFRVRIAIAAYTAVALVGIAIVGWRGYTQRRVAGGRMPHDMDTSADRHRFLGFASLLLSGLSALAVLYAALVVVFIEDCR